MIIDNDLQLNLINWVDIATPKDYPNWSINPMIFVLLGEGSSPG